MLDRAQLREVKTLTGRKTVVTEDKASESVEQTDTIRKSVRDTRQKVDDDRVDDVRSVEIRDPFGLSVEEPLESCKTKLEGRLGESIIVVDSHAQGFDDDLEAPET